MTTITNQTALTAQRTYASQDNAEKALLAACSKMGRSIGDIVWLIGVNAEGRFVPTVVGLQDRNREPNTAFAFVGVMVIG